MNKFFKILLTFTTIIVTLVVVFNVRLKNIEIVDNHNISDEEFSSKLFESTYDSRSIVLYLKDKFRPKKKIPLVNSYDIEWLTPFSIVIHVHETQIIGFIRRDLKNVYFDKNGTIVEVSEERKEGVIEVIGVSFRNFEVGENVEISNKKILSAILNITNYLNENKLHSELMEIKQDDTIYLYMGNIIVNLGDTKNMEVKLNRLKDIFPNIETMSGELDLSNAKENMLDEQYIFKKTA